eukprot:evm.model.scf_577EXC.11 EVM.evm.TU.scf_577EXC.11   scf_577EXC:75761-76822(-)
MAAAHQATFRPPPQPADVEKGAPSHDGDPERRPLIGPKNGAGGGPALPSVPPELLSGVCYCVASISMVLLNKMVLSGFAFDAPNALLLFQCVVAVALVSACGAAGLVQLDALDWRVVRLWLPVNVIFVGMIWSGFYSLRNLGVAMVTLLKNLTNFVVILGDLVFFKKRYGAMVWGSLVLMFVSALAGAITDLSFNATGYAWQIVNCLFTGSYSLFLKFTMSKIAIVTEKKRGLEEGSMVLYNNLLSLPLIFMLMVYFGETTTLWQQPALWQPGFLLAACLSGVVGFAISFASLWFLNSTTPTTYSLTGSLNKIPTAVLGMVLFQAPVDVKNVISILLGLSAGVLFVRAKATGR